MEKCSSPPQPSSSSTSPSSSSSSSSAGDHHVQPKAWTADVDVPLFFRCPISMEIMEDPVTISTGVTYDRKSIEKWFYVYKKTTCPATMQPLPKLHLTPNHTLRRLISAFHASTSPPPPPLAEPPPPPGPATTAELLAVLNTIQSSPFKVSSLKKLRSAVAAAGDEVAMGLVRSGGVDVLRHIVERTSKEGCNDFTDFQAAEEAVGIIQLLPLPSDLASVQALTTPACMNSMVALLQHGSSRARLHAMTLMQKIARTSKDWCRAMADQDLDFYKSLVDLLSDETSTVATSASIDVLTELTTVSKCRRLRAVEAGACPVLIELLPTASRHKCERLLFLLKLLCKCPEGRSAVTEHGMGVAVVSKIMLRVSDTATKLAVKIMWSISSSWAGTAKVVDEMMAFGAVKKLLALLQMDCKASTKQTAARILRLHGGAWQHHRCLAAELREYLRLTRAR